jgi:hypothetical protein
VSYRPPNRAPGDRSHVERLVQALSVEQGMAADGLRCWVSTTVLLGALERVGDDEHRFLLSRAAQDAQARACRLAEVQLGRGE